MDTYIKNVDIRWSDLDPNFHVTHSAYYDFGAFIRMSFLTEFGIGPAFMMENNLGPVLLREECVFRREIHFGDKVTISLALKQASPTYSRWSFRHEIAKNGNIISAIITVEGAWIHTTRRKLINPPDPVTAVFETIPRSPDFGWR